MGDEFRRDAYRSVSYDGAVCEGCYEKATLIFAFVDGIVGWWCLRCLGLELPAVVSPHTPTPSPKDSEREVKT